MSALRRAADRMYAELERLAETASEVDHQLINEVLSDVDAALAEPDELAEARKLLKELEPIVEAGVRQLARYRFDTDRLSASTRYDLIRRKYLDYLKRTEGQ